jgi:hypothetical protein
MKELDPQPMLTLLGAIAGGAILRLVADNLDRLRFFCYLESAKALFSLAINLVARSKQR